MLNITPNNITDTGPAPPRLARPDQRALKRRIWFLEAEQAARRWRSDKHYAQAEYHLKEADGHLARSKALRDNYEEEQPQLRRMREIVLNEGGA